MKNGKRFLLFLLVVAALTAGSLALWAHPVSIKCPIDGDFMTFDHQVGTGDQAVCWYSHTAYVSNPDPDGVGPVAVKHKAYTSCDD